MHHMTVRNVPLEVAEALKAEKKKRGTSLNQLVIDLLTQSLGVRRGRRSNGLARLAGRWSEEDRRGFEEAIAPLETIDEELWR